jgi:hypothetical protein
MKLSVEKGIVIGARSSSQLPRRKKKKTARFVVSCGVENDECQGFCDW